MKVLSCPIVGREGGIDASIGRLTVATLKGSDVLRVQ
jgi:hypothetical protein